MNIVIAPDSYKGSLTQMEVASIIRDAIQNIQPQSKVVLRPMADGGEGTLDVILSAFDVNKRLKMGVTGPLGQEVMATVGVIQEKLAIIEVARIIGLPLLKASELNPYKTTTYGVGEAIKNLLDQGIRKFVIGLGGSATNDGGLGMLIALGATIKDHSGKRIGIFGADLCKVAHVDLTTLDIRLRECDISIASDVTNPLYGPTGATHIFGQQKGATTEQKLILDVALKKYSDLIEHKKQISLSKQSGAGAAGGLGFAFLLLGGKIMSGAQLIAEIVDLEMMIKQADLVITGEGKSDKQTVLGKTPHYVAEKAKEHNVPIYLISGQICEQARSTLARHFDRIYELTDKTMSLERAIKEANMLLLKKITEIFRRM